MSKVRLADGSTLAHGQIVRNVARDGAPKRLTDPTPGVGMKRQTTGDLHPYLHGQSVDDTASDKLCMGQQVPVHSGMGSKTMSTRGTDGDGFGILGDAGPASWRSPAHGLDRVGKK
jgi:hypothetical protein